MQLPRKQTGASPVGSNPALSANTKPCIMTVHPAGHGIGSHDVEQRRTLARGHKGSISRWLVSATRLHRWQLGKTGSQSRWRNIDAIRATMERYELSIKGIRVKPLLQWWKSIARD